MRRFKLCNTDCSEWFGSLSHSPPYVSVWLYSGCTQPLLQILVRDAPPKIHLVISKTTNIFSVCSAARNSNLVVRHAVLTTGGCAG